MPAFEDKPLPRERLAWEHKHNRAIRVGRWKLVSQKGKNWELYDIDADSVELYDLASTDAERVKDMTRQWDTWAMWCNVLPYPGGK